MSLTGLAVALDHRFVVTVSNVGNETLELGTTTLSGVDGYAITQRPTSIAPGESAEIVVVVRPLVAAPLQSMLTIASNATNAATVDVLLEAFAFDAGLPDIVIENASCAFGDVVVGEASAPCDVSLRNVGVRDLILDAVTFSACDVDCPFRLSSLVAPQTALAPGTAAGLTLLFVPSSIGAFDTRLVITTNDPDEPEMAVQLTGTGVAAP